MNKIKLAVFASTRGTDLQAVIDGVKSGELDFVDLKFVLSDKEECGAMVRAKEAGITTFFVNPRGKTRAEFDSECLKACQENGIDLILLIGYMRIMTSVIIGPFKQRIMNIHPSLLPKYPGMDLDVHREVLKNGKKESGCTLHWVTEDLDAGPIILQKKVAIAEGETPESLKAKVQEREQETILEGLKMFANKIDRL
ncbi:MAG TPA: phosphoribosylglycinamide formyltransferase [Patescibacteria group bacterium]|nr:phosphoribosylglycinamide formyltransferase [Patescibacteria group bacterium]